MADLTNRDILLRVMEGLDSVKTDVAEIKGGLTPTVQAVADHELRIRSLERFKNAVPSVAALGFLMGVASFLYSIFA